MNDPLVYVLIINWNGREHLDACFESLLASTYPNARFLLVDNGSDDDSIAHVESRFGDDPRVSILPCATNLGWSGGNNAGIRHALEHDADYIFLLNNDTVVAPDCIAALVKAMAARPDGGALAPRMLLFDQPCLINSVGLEMSIIGAAWDRGIGRADGAAWHDEIPVAGACGGACFLRASVLEKTGLLPEEFEIYLDDLDLCLRIWHAGFTVWTCPSAVVRHKFSATMGQGAWARRKYYLNTRNRFWVLARNFPTGRLLAVLPWVLVGEARAVGRALLEGAFWRIGSHVRAWASAVRNLPRARRACPARSDSPLWRLIRRSPLFCPVLSLPVDGWYGPIEVDGVRLRPMAPVATCEIPAGPLRLSLVNCYPELGSAKLSVSLNGAELGTLESTGRSEVLYDTDAGTLTLHASSIFLASETDHSMDIGAWMQIHSCGNPLV